MSLVATRLEEYTLSYDRSNFDAWEHRMSNYGAYATFLGDTENLLPGAGELIANRNAAVRTVRIPVINRKDFSTSSSRSCSAQSHELTSAYSTPTWTTLQAGFNMRKAEHWNNHISYQNAFNNKMQHLERAFLEAFDTAAYTHLNTNVSQVNAADGNPYTVVSNAMVVPAADNELFYNELGPIMNANDLPDTGINVVSSPRNQALVREYSSQGTSNAENRVFQFGGYNFAYSNRVSVATTDRDTVFAMPVGSLGFLSWIDIDSQMGNTSTDGKEWSVASLPRVGIDVGVLYQSTCTDASSSIGTGYEATLSESWSFSVDYSHISAYNSDTASLAGVIYKSRFTKT
jgi:hypothetical protein